MDVLLWVKIVCFCGYVQGISIWNAIQLEEKVRWIARAIEAKDLTSLFLDDNITVFLPSNEAYFDYVPAHYGYSSDNDDHWKDLLLYSSVKGSFLHNNLQDGDMFPSRYDPSSKLYINKYAEGKKKILTVNGARFLESDIETENGVLHIIDRLLAPIATNRSVSEYLENPKVPNLAFTSIIKAKIVVPDLVAQTQNLSLLFTSFSPNDSFLFSMPAYGIDTLFSDWELLENVYRAHIVPHGAYFLPETGLIPNLKASKGNLSFKRYNGEVYVYNNLVRARIVHSNIPTGNGVLHVVDNLLYFVYDNIIQRLKNMPETRTMYKYIKRLPDPILDEFARSDKLFTVFAPTEDAFGKIPTSVQQELNRTDEDGLKMLKHLFDGHIVPGMKLDAAMLSRDQILLTIDNRTINVIHVDGDTYLESGTIRARIEITDIGCTNGVVHLISNLLFFRNFTIWEAISNIPELRMMHEFAIQYSDIEQKLSSVTSGAMTMFIASNSALRSTSSASVDTLKAYPHMVYQALRGQIIQGQFSSSSVSNSVQVGTLAGKSLRIYRGSQIRRTNTAAMMVEGSHVKARVIVKDIWCSNGVLHIVDDILHIAIRSIVEEMARRPEVSYTRNLFQHFPALEEELSKLSKSFTVFVPHNDAYARLPWEAINSLLQNVNKTGEILKAHVVSGKAKYVDELTDRQMLKAEKNVIFIIKKHGNVYAVNNNMWAKVVSPDIRAANGVLHVIDRLIYYPYKTVSETLDDTEELRTFYDMMNVLPEFFSLVNKGERNMTLFVPSSGYLNSLAPSKLALIRSNTDILRKIYRGHMLPYVRLDDEFLRRYPVQEFVSRSSLNTTFTLRRNGGEAYIDAGFEKTYVDLIGRGYGCSNGIIYSIEGFLNYSPYNLMERLLDIGKIEYSLEYLLRLVNYTTTDVLKQDGRSFTIFMPHKEALRNLSYTDFATMDNFPLSERLKVFWRHILNNTAVTYQDLRHGRIPPGSLPPGVTLENNDSGVFFKWKHVIAKVVESDKLASNGVIHILDSFLFTTSDPETTTFPAETTTREWIHASFPTTASLAVKDNSSHSCLPSLYILIISYILVGLILT